LNVYCLVEGRVTEKKVYSSWIPLVNPQLSVVPFLQQVQSNNVFIISGEGLPQLFSRIAASSRDMAQFPIFDRFVISLDCEEMDPQAKLNELMTHVHAAAPPVPVHPIVQHYCFETWALGNRKIARKPSELPQLSAFKQHYDVQVNDPSLMPSIDQTRYNRAEFSETYLRLLLNNQRKNLSYSKANPSAICHPKYFDQVRSRLLSTGHITSFQQFLSAFS
jgi:hypothetical protein